MITVILTPTAPYTPKALHLTDASAKVTLGRNHDDIVCTDENGFFPCELAQTLSRRHAELFVGDKAKVWGRHFVYVYIKDLGSSNGTFLNEVKVDSDAPVEVKSGDTLVSLVR
ncbi:hypothetical protein BDZ89DRAFT_1075302 [Hymenopellis radicata]|nr:hypothetical protein BDZ89DRAFT_1075302 [Hymenopellis radicata]